MLSSAFLVVGILSVAAQTQSPTNALTPKSTAECAVTFEEGYVAWICDDSAREFTPSASLYFVRTNMHGAFRATRIWAGALGDLKASAAATIAGHRAANAGCSAWVHIVGITGGEVQWNRVTDNMRKWWDSSARTAAPGVCYTPDVTNADFLFVWHDVTTRIPYSFSMPVPQTTFSSGTINMYGSNGYAYGNYSGLSTTTQMETYQGTRATWDVTVEVLPVEPKGNSTEAVLGSVAYTAENIGKWRWSKPDKDGLESAMTYVASRLRASATARPSTKAPPSAPPGAVARCADGQFVFVSTGNRTCSANGGVSAWFK